MLQHPHIVHITDFDTTERGEPYIVMELLQGESLGQRLERERIVPMALAVRIACQAASGLAAVHEAKTVHRDLKRLR
jgi:eukaryotic-like serine/threonine-protein kinase